MDRDAIVEVVAALGGAAVFIAGMIVVGMRFGTDGLSRQGGLAMVGVIGLFVLVMTGAGYWLSRRSA